MVTKKDLADKLPRYLTIVTILVIVGVIGVVAAQFWLASRPLPPPPTSKEKVAPKPIRILVIERGTPARAACYICDATERAKRIAKTETKRPVTTIKGDSAFLTDVFDLVILNDYRNPQGVSKHLKNKEPASHRIAEFVANGKVALAINSSFLADNETLRQVFGAYFLPEETRETNYLVLSQNHDLTTGLPSKLSTAGKYGENPYIDPEDVPNKISLDKSSNSSVQVLIKDAHDHPALTLASYKDGYALCLSLSNIGSLPSADESITTLARNPHIRIIANAIKLAASQK